MAAQGYHVPEHYNPAEFIADLIAVDPSSPAAEAASRCDTFLSYDASQPYQPCMAVPCCDNWSHGCAGWSYGLGECRRTVEKLHAAFASQAAPRSMGAASSSSSYVNAAPSTGSEVQCSLPTQAKLLFKRSWSAALQAMPGLPFCMYSLGLISCTRVSL